MKKYDNYKDSGIEWIGEIPEHWNINRLRNIADSIKTGSTPPSEEIQYFEPKDINWYGPGDFDDLILYDAKRKISNLSIKENKCRLFPPNSILLIGIGATVGKVGIVSEASTSNQQINAIILKNEYNPKYYTYFISTIKDIIVMEASSATLPIFNQTQTKNIVLPVPEIFEQTTIANYLDHKTTQIDTLIFKKQQFITLLQEERTAVINQAVTKGLDPKVKMKDSGIEWLGEIPEHWEVKSFRFCIDILTDYTANGSFASLAENVTYFDSGYSRLVRLTDLRVNLENEGLYVDENAHNFLKKSELFGGELLIANVGAYAGLVMQMPSLEGKYTLGPNMFLLRLNQNTDFFINQLNAPFCAEQLKMMAVSSAQPKLNKENIRQLKVVTPPIDEQNLITKIIKKEKERIDTLISKSQQEIELLKEYKTALISEVVTGKVDVRDVILN